MRKRLFQTSNATVNLFSRAIHTIHQVHFILIFALGHLLAPLITNDVLLYLVLSVATIGVGLAIHGVVMEPSDSLRLVLNGRRRAGA